MAFGAANMSIRHKLSIDLDSVAAWLEVIVLLGRAMNEHVRTWPFCKHGRYFPGHVLIRDKIAMTYVVTHLGRSQCEATLVD